MTIEPTVARVVYFSPFIDDGEMDRDEGPFAGIITKVWNDNLVNLAVFDKQGHVKGRQRVPLVQDGQFPLNPEAAFCAWMPYQRGQAAKTDELVAALTARIEALEAAEANRKAELERWRVMAQSAGHTTLPAFSNGDAEKPA